MKKIIAVLVAIFMMFTLTACDNPQEARRTLVNAGFKDIQAGGYDLFACGKDDFFSTRFTATNPSGVKVNGVVCSGFFKGSTIRF